MDLIPQFDELWVISDIHMGGVRTASQNFQIFRRGERLANFIRRLANERPADNLALLLNGDIIDSLAEEKAAPGYIAIDVDAALTMMERIYNDPSFATVWDELGKFVRTPNRHLVLVVGNHDIELALTVVQSSLRKRLAGDDQAAQSRLRFSTQGGGFACNVGSKRVFCTHGNEVDPWNVVDYDKLGSLDNAMNAGRRVDATRWIPNSGTRLVIDVMNQVKKSYPFVDLLKPENKPVLSTLLTLDPGLVKQVQLSAPINVVRGMVTGNREVSALLSAGVNPEDVVSTATLEPANIIELMGPNLAEGIRTFQSGSEDDLLLAAERNLAGNLATDAMASTPAGATLGMGDLVAGALGLLDKDEALRRALKDWLGNDDTFDITKEDETFKAIVPRVGPGVDFIVTGHTHLARNIECSGGRRYFNCGTWIRLLRLTPQALKDKQVFSAIYDSLKQGTMEALDKAAKIPGANGDVDLLLDRTDAVKISSAGAAVTGKLIRVTGGENGASINLDLEEKGGLGA